MKTDMHEMMIIKQNLRQSLSLLPEHKCAYCGSGDTYIRQFDIEPSSRKKDPTITARIKCNNCNQEDHPSLGGEVLKSVFRFW